MKERPHYHGHRQRLREKLLKDPNALPDYEVLECLLSFVVPRKDTKPLAKDLLQRFKTIRGVFAADPDDLKELKGFGDSLHAFWVAFNEVRTRYDESAVAERVALNNPQVVADLALSRLGGNALEEIWVALVDNKNRLMAWECISKGTVNETPVYPRDVLAPALERKAGGLIIVHNHPGGDPKPSSQDIALTKRITRAADDLGVRMLDHIIVAEKDYFSFKASGLIE